MGITNYHYLISSRESKWLNWIWTRSPTIMIHDHVIWSTIQRTAQLQDSSKQNNQTKISISISLKRPPTLNKQEDLTITGNKKQSWFHINNKPRTKSKPSYPLIHNIWTRRTTNKAKRAQRRVPTKKNVLQSSRLKMRWVSRHLAVTQINRWVMASYRLHAVWWAK